MIDDNNDNSHIPTQRETGKRLDGADDEDIDGGDLLEL